MPTSCLPTAGKRQAVGTAAAREIDKPFTGWERQRLGDLAKPLPGQQAGED